MDRPTLLILAGGAGSRHGGGKMLEPVGPNGELIVEYSIHDARRAGFGRIVFVIRKEVEQEFYRAATARFNQHFNAECVIQELGKLARADQVPPGRTKLWGTTHAVLMAAGSIHHPFAVINVNDFYGPGSYRALAAHLKSGSSDYALVGFVLRDTLSAYGSVARAICNVNESDCLDKIVELKNVEREGGRVFNLDPGGEETHLTGDEVVSMNMWAFTPRVFDQLRERFQKFLEKNGGDPHAECSIPNAINEILVSGQEHVKVLRAPEAWFGITYGEDHSRAVENIRRHIEAGYYPRHLWA